jgi:hypothetical protein
MALRSQVVNLVRLHLLDDSNEIRRIREISIVQLETHVSLVRVLIKVIDAIGVERGRSAFYSMYGIPLRE